MWCGYWKLFYLTGFFIDAVFFVTMLHGSMEVIGSLLTFCDSTFWSLVFDVDTGYLIEVSYNKTN